MNYKVAGWDTRWDMGLWDGTGASGMGQEPPGKDMRQDRRSQEETVQEDMEHQDGTRATGMGHKVTDEDGTGHEPLGWDGRWDRRSQEGTGGVRMEHRMGQEPPRCDTSHCHGT